MIIVYFILIFNIVWGQVSPYQEPYLINDSESKLIKYATTNNNSFILDVKNGVTHHSFELLSKDLYRININNDHILNDISFFIIDLDSYAFNGPYTNQDSITDPLNTKNIIIEVINNSTNTITIEASIEKYESKIISSTHINQIPRRENPIIVVTGYWPPTNEMIRHFSQDNTLNNNGWEGENWENRGYDIISYFPTFDDPICTNCGQGNGLLKVDYQNTSNDFWPIVNEHNPIAIITFSRGFNNQSWELENNYYNRTNWINDYESPFLPTPNPPDTDQESFFLRNSNLPMNEIIQRIDDLDIGLDAYIDINGDPGRFVSEFMGYHGVWYRDINQTDEFKCISAGHVHVGGQIEVETAKLATNETIRTLINYLDQNTYIPGDTNNDDIVDILDLVQIINNILGNAELTNLQFLASDINQDNIINIQDIILVVNIILNN
tara:strand:- start:121 stop:1434 length:1314 start_codon:yes stop_codon:yes gene_type:complete